MARLKTYEVGCLNIRVHTQHHPSEYDDLWRRLFSMRTPYVWPSTQAMMIGEAVRKAVGPTQGYFGYLYRFIRLDADAGWFNIDAHKPADEDELANIQIPQSLQPNLRMLPYYFDIQRHRLYFISHEGKTSISGGQISKLINFLCEQPRISERFGVVEVQQVSDHVNVDRLLHWPVIKRLEIVLERPNPTDFEDEANAFGHLHRLGAKRMKREYVKADEAETLTPDEELRQLAPIAADNGNVRVTGVDPGGVARTAESSDYPWKERVTYNSAVQLLTDSFLDLVANLFSRRRL